MDRETSGKMGFEQLNERIHGQSMEGMTETRTDRRRDLQIDGRTDRETDIQKDE